MDEAARRAYWAEVIEWGPAGRPARIDARIGADNALHADLDNVAVAKFDLAAAPVDRKLDLRVVIGSARVGEVSAPLPDAVYLVRGKYGWTVSAKAPETPPQRLHFPGGAGALFHGEPLMVVWGTGGDEATNKAMHAAAEAARRSPGPRWADGPMMAFGRLPGKPDSKVTRADMAKYNLLLIGTAAQNAVVAQLAGKLPVRIAKGKITTDDGASWDAKGRAVGLLHCNPLAPRRLIYWAASEDAGFYRAETPMMGRQGEHGPDFVVCNAQTGLPVAARRFTSRWQWQPGYADSPKLPKSACSETGWPELLARAVCRDAGADFGLVRDGWEPGPHWTAGQTREMDVLVWQYSNPIGTMELTGREIAEFRAARVKTPRYKVRLLAAEAGLKVRPERTYRVALPAGGIWRYVKTGWHQPESFRTSDRLVQEALRRHFAAVSP
jgi:hypothetical protein